MLLQFGTIPSKAKSVQKCKVSDILFHLSLLRWMWRFGKVWDKGLTSGSSGLLKEILGRIKLTPCSVQTTNTGSLHALLFKKFEMPAG